MMKFTLLKVFFVAFWFLLITKSGNAFKSREKEDNDMKNGTSDEDLMFVGIQLRFTGFSNEDVIPAVNVSSSQGTTAFQLLQLASKQNPCYLFEYQTFEGLGHYITTICCVAQNTTTHSYWFVYINNTLSPVGVDFLKPNNGDILRFEYRSINYIDGNHTEPTPTTAAEQQQAVQTITISVKLAFRNYPNPNVIPEQKVIASNGTAAFELLQLAGKQHPCYTFNYKTFSFGRYITTICCVEENKIENFYWFIYLNGEPASVGVDLLKPKDKDVLVFEYRVRDLAESNHTLPTTKTIAPPPTTKTATALPLTTEKAIASPPTSEKATALPPQTKNTSVPLPTRKKATVPLTTKLTTAPPPTTIQATALPPTTTKRATAPPQTKKPTQQPPTEKTKPTTTQSQLLSKPTGKGNKLAVFSLNIFILAVAAILA